MFVHPVGRSQHAGSTEIVLQYLGVGLLPSKQHKPSRLSTDPMRARLAAPYAVGCLEAYYARAAEKQRASLHALLVSSAQAQSATLKHCAACGMTPQS